MVNKLAMPAVVAGMLSMAAVAEAQDSRYSSDFSNPPAAAATPAAAVGSDTADLVDELNALIDAAAGANAADPVFLQDLRDLATRYAWPWRTLVVAESGRKPPFRADSRGTLTFLGSHPGTTRRSPVFSCCAIRIGA